ncbi:hypothetical protein HYS54_03330, partial [Candidatus Micrarchaeota archaeon]|nr:hypothetical protein [Candidatus Micrarchaeota archaeon]
SLEHDTTLQSSLKQAWKAIDGQKIAIVILIDEASMLQRNRAELLLYLKAVLEQLQIDKIPVMILPAGTHYLLGPSGTGFSPIVRAFPPVYLVNFTEAESRAFVEKKVSYAGIECGNELFRKIYEVTEGHPFVITAYLWSIYSKLTAGETKISSTHLDAADVEFVDHVLAPFFARFYDKTGKASRDLLTCMAQEFGNEASISDLSSFLKKETNELSPYLAKLVQDGSLLRIDRGKYRFFHHLMVDYIKNKAKTSNH